MGREKYRNEIGLLCVRGVEWLEVLNCWKEFCIIIFGIMRTIQGQLLEWKRLTLSASVVLLWARGR